MGQRIGHRYSYSAFQANQLRLSMRQLIAMSKYSDIEVLRGKRWAFLSLPFLVGGCGVAIISLGITGASRSLLALIIIPMIFATFALSAFWEYQSSCCPVCGFWLRWRHDCGAGGYDFELHAICPKCKTDLHQSFLLTTPPVRSVVTKLVLWFDKMRNGCR